MVGASTGEADLSLFTEEAQGNEVKKAGWGEWDRHQHKLPASRAAIAGTGRKASSSFGESGSQLAVRQRTAGRAQRLLRSRT